MKKIALMLGGGAPNFTLMSGALLGLHQKGIEFNVVSMAGAGAVVGLLYLAPKSLTPEQSLENTVNFGISDSIYDFFPINYKAFTKWGPSADEFNKYWSSLPMVQKAAHQYGKTPAQKLQDDWLLFLGAMLCPTDLTPASTGLCGHPHFIDNLIDFERIRSLKQEIEINAFRLRDRQIVDFKKSEITADHLRAALSFPLIYPPYMIGGELYYEGAAFQCINPTNAQGVDHFVVLQPMAPNQIRAPRDLWDAYSLSVMMPIAALAQYGVDTAEELAGIEDPNEQELVIKDALAGNDELQKIVGSNYGQAFELVKRAMDVVKSRKFADLEIRSASGNIPIQALRSSERAKWHEAKFEIPEDRLSSVFEWSRSNLEYLFEVGYEAGEILADEINS